MNKKVIIVALLCFISIASKSQETFKINFSFPESQLFKNCIELRNGTLLLVGSSHNSLTPPFNNSNAFLYNIGPAGDTSTFSYRYNDTALAFHSIIEREDGTLLVMGSVSAPPYTRFKLMSFLLDTSYNIITKSVLIDSEFLKVDPDFLLKKGNSLFLIGKVDYSHHLFVKMDLSGNINQYVLESENNDPYELNDVLFNNDSTKIWILGNGYNGEGKLSKLELDTSLNMLSHQLIPEGSYLNYMSVKLKSCDSLITVSQFYNYQIHDDNIRLSVVDTLFNPLTPIVYFGTDETRDTPGTQGGIDFRNPDTIFIVGTIGMASEFYPAYYNEIQFTSLDKNLNSLSQTYLGGDANYIAETIHECADGNVVVIATAYDYQNQNNYFDVKVWKLNRQGLLTKIKAPKETEFQSLQLFPNPSNKSVTLNFKQSPGSLEIYDANSIIFKRLIDTQQITIDVKSWANGVYYIRYISDNSLYTAKFIKF